MADTTYPTDKSSVSKVAYQGLARKYRPNRFEDMIGHQAMVQTLRNAFRLDRIAQAYMLTGVRGIGKTTTARILARALNYETGGDPSTGPSVDMAELGTHCQAIIESRHIDVIEMDAASHTGINDIREITDAVKYKPASARYKVYIIDEVHMLSKAAFNGLLKTLEEPPEHVKFIFATTEIRKVPITILSRCQRFDLRRIDGEVMADYLRTICEREGVSITDEALTLLARASEGSMRDGLSLLDQSIAHAASAASGEITAPILRDMLGLADRARIMDLFKAVMKGDCPAALAELKDQYDSGAEPSVVLTDLADFVHLVTSVKAVGDIPMGSALPEVEAQTAKEMAETLSIRALSRSWQMLLKGIEEVQMAHKPIAAADMVLVRMIYASNLPEPDDVLRKLREQQASSSSHPQAPSAPSGGSSGAPSDGASSLRIASTSAVSGGAPAMSAPVSQPQQITQHLKIARFEDLVELATEKRALSLRVALENNVRLVHFEDGRIEFNTTQTAPKSLTTDLMAKLKEWTGKRWVVAISREEGDDPLSVQRESEKTRQKEDARTHPTVAAVLETFPGAKIVNVIVKANEEADIPLSPDTNLDNGEPIEED